jgi:hypothetical protein
VKLLNSCSAIQRAIAASSQVERIASRGVSGHLFRIGK